MPDHVVKNHLLSYDIADPRRLSKIHRYMKKRAMPVQYSVFLLQCSAESLREVTQGVQSLLNEKEDDVRIYTLPGRVKVRVIGNQALPSGIDLLGPDKESYAKRF